MNDRKKQVMSFVRKRLMYWQTEPNPHLVRADLGLARSRESYLSSGSFCFGIFQRSL